MQGYVEVLPLDAESFLASDEKKFIEAAKVINVSPTYPKDVIVDTETRRIVEKSFLSIGDIIFFRPHGFFETPEYEGKKHYVVRVSEEFILGKITPDVAEI